MSEANKATEIFATADAKAQRVIDGFQNFASKVGLNNDNSISESFYAFNLMTRNRIQLEAAYRGSWVVGKVIDVVAEDMTRAGIDVTSHDDDAQLKDLMSSMTRLKVQQSFASLIKWGRLYGGALGVLQIAGQDLSTPLNLDTVAKGQFKGMVVYDRWQLNPVLDQVIMEGPEMGLPKFYDIVNIATSPQPVAPTMTGQIRVHHSRVVRNIGIELPYFQAITEMMWGESVLERLWDRLIAFDDATMSSANLIERANNRTVRISGLREIIAAGGKAQQGLEAMFEMMRTFQTNEGLTLLDKEDEFATTSYSFAGLSDVMLQFGQQLAGASEIPLVRFFGQSPAGLSATGESDLRMYYDGINSQQESRLRSGYDLILNVMWRSTFGKAPPKDLEFTFVPLWQMSAVDKSTIAKSNTETIIGAHEAGLISTESAMKELRDSSDETGLFASITDEEIADAEVEEPPAPEPGAGDPTPQDVIKNADSKPLTAAARIKAWLTRK